MPTTTTIGDFPPSLLPSTGEQPVWDYDDETSGKFYYSDFVGGNTGQYKVEYPATFEYEEVPFEVSTGGKEKIEEEVELPTDRLYDFLDLG